MRRASVSGLLAAFGLAGCIGEAPPEITLYAKRDFRGVRETVRGPIPDLGRALPELDDEVSSFEIQRGVWRLCKKTRYRSCRTADESMADLGEWDLDNTISSLRPVED
jgi:hypothetical protein